MRSTMLNAIATDDDGIADIAHEVLPKIYSYAILNYTMASHITFRKISYSCFF